jgi:hypothetical protein
MLDDTPLQDPELDLGARHTLVKYRIYKLRKRSKLHLGPWTLAYMNTIVYRGFSFEDAVRKLWLELKVTKKDRWRNWHAFRGY